MKRYFAVIPTLMLLCGAHAASAQTDGMLRLNPSGPWAIDYGERACTLSRSFGAAEGAIKINFTRTLAPLQTGISIEGDGVETHHLSRVNVIEFWTDNVAFSAEFIYGFGRSSVPPNVLGGQVRSLASAQNTTGIRELRLSQRGRGSLANLMVGDLTAPLTALQNCQDHLYRSMGIDVAAMRAIVTDAEPANREESWATTDDLPPSLIGRLDGVTAVAMRLDINAEGRPTNCTVTESSTIPLLDLQSCRVLMARALYRPARNAVGEAVPSVALRRIRWQAPN
jgi:hypothetical protein